MSDWTPEVGKPALWRPFPEDAGYLVTILGVYPDEYRTAHTPDALLCELIMADGTPQTATEDELSPVDQDGILSPGVRVMIDSRRDMGVREVVCSEAESIRRSPRWAGTVPVRQLCADGSGEYLQATVRVVDTLIVTDSGDSFPAVLWTGGGR